MENKGKHETTQCPRCSGYFSCTRTIDCWCMKTPIPAQVKEHLAAHYDGCLCPDCIEELKNTLLTKHTYYYAGDKVKAEPEHVEDDLARFRYEFPDQSVYHLNMYPLRKKYMEKLLKETGFQTIETYGDFEETYQTENPDFYIHIADKRYENEI